MFAARRVTEDRENCGDLLHLALIFVCGNVHSQSCAALCAHNCTPRDARLFARHCVRHFALNWTEFIVPCTVPINKKRGLRGNKATLIVFVLLFSTVRIQISPQIACLIRCKVALIAFVYLYPTVLFQMCLQMACIRACKVILFAYV